MSCFWCATQYSFKVMTTISFVKTNNGRTFKCLCTTHLGCIRKDEQWEVGCCPLNQPQAEETNKLLQIYLVQMPLQQNCYQNKCFNLQWRVSRDLNIEQLWGTFGTSVWFLVGFSGAGRCYELHFHILPPCLKYRHFYLKEMCLIQTITRLKIN